MLNRVLRFPIAYCSKPTTPTLHLSQRTFACSARCSQTGTIQKLADKMVRPAGWFSNRYTFDDMPDMSGKVAVVTGGSRGVGEATVASLVRKGCEVHILSATKEHADTAISNISSTDPSLKSLMHYHQVDLGTLSSVISLAADLAKSLPRIDILLCIAGIGVGPFALTNDGLGNHFAVNHLSHFALVDGLLPKLLETSKEKYANATDEAEKYSTRIVAMSSELHRAAPSDVKCESIEEMSHEKDPLKLYARSKLCNALFIRELAKKHLPSLSSTTPILALATHPGTVATEQQEGATEGYGMIGKVLEAARPLMMDREQGAESILWASTSKAVMERRNEVQGEYFSEADGKSGTQTSQAMDDELAKKLWDLSVSILKEKENYVTKM